MSPPSDIIQFECPLCLSNVRADKSKAGERVECPDCGQSLQVPAASTVTTGAFDDLFEGPISLAPLDDEPVSDADSTPESLDQIPADEPVNVEPSDEVVEVTDGDLIADETDLAAGIEVAEANSQDLEGDDPFAIPQDLPPLKIDGITKEVDIDDVYGIKCTICDTRIHVVESQAGTIIECPVCFSKITVSERPATPVNKPVWEKPGQEPTPEAVIESEQDENEDVQIEEGYGLAPLDDDLLRPKDIKFDEPFMESDAAAENDETDAVDNPFVHDDIFDIATNDLVPNELPEEPPEHSPENDSSVPDADNHEPVRDEPQDAPGEPGDEPLPPPKPEPTRQMSRRERLQEAEAQQDEQEDIFSIGADASDKLDFQPFTIHSLFERVKTSLLTPGTLIGMILCIGLLGAGAMMYFQADHIGHLMEKGEEVSSGQKWLRVLLLFVFSILWFFGTVGLLYVASMLFRDNALGKTHVESWRFRGLEDIQSTVLLFAFSFVIVGLPIGAFFGDVLANPFRILVCPPLLLFAWYNRSPFNILAAEALRDVKDEPHDWQTFVAFIIMIAIVCLLGGACYSIPWSPMSAVGAAVQCITICAFAAVTGWHVGRACARLQGLGP